MRRPLSSRPRSTAGESRCSGATHVAGRLPLTLAEASVAQAALRRATDGFDGSAQAARERLREALWQKALADGAE